MASEDPERTRHPTSAFRLLIIIGFNPASRNHGVQKDLVFRHRADAARPSRLLRYASRDAVRKHCRLRHGEWLKEQGTVASQSPDHPPPKPPVPKPFAHLKSRNAHVYDSPALYSMPSESLYTLPAFELLDPEYFCPHSSPGSEEDEEPFMKSPRCRVNMPEPSMPVKELKEMPADPQLGMGRALKALLASGLL